MDKNARSSDIELAVEAARAYLRTCLLEAAKAAQLLEELQKLQRDGCWRAD